tara:strand:+ start:1899 stop:2432 length:534 start_codon:yes stop_codon:yes gene_type:complete
MFASSVLLASSRDLVLNLALRVLLARILFKAHPNARRARQVKHRRKDLRLNHTACARLDLEEPVVHPANPGFMQRKERWNNQTRNACHVQQTKLLRFNQPLKRIVYASLVSDWIHLLIHLLHASRVLMVSILLAARTSFAVCVGLEQSRNLRLKRRPSTRVNVTPHQAFSDFLSCVC